MSGIETEDVKIRMADGIGYKTPKVDIRAVIFNEEGHLLMVREKIDGCWSIPGGWADIGYTPSEIAVKEAREEAGVEVEPERILAILDKRCHDHPADIYYVYKIFIECRLMGAVAKKNDETDDAGFFAEDHMPPLSGPRNTEGQIKMLFDMRRGLVTPPVFD
jgi:ADP-ribose pyrophosphatase YjhB (NUDIX family)